MATKNELDAMLEKLRTGGRPAHNKTAPAPQKPESNSEPERPAQEKKSPDPVSVTQLISKLSQPEKPSVTAPQPTAQPAASQISVTPAAEEAAAKPAETPTENVKESADPSADKPKNRRSKKSRKRSQRLENMPSVPEAAETESRSDPSEELIDSLKSQASEMISGITEKKPAEPEKAESLAKPAEEPAEESESAPEKPRKKSGITAALQSILDEDPDSLAHERAEKSEPDSPEDAARKSTSHKLRQRIYAIFGVLFTIFAVIGFISVCKTGVNYFRSFTSGEEKRSDFIDIIYPAVTMDISEFSSPAELESDQIISSAIWMLIMNADDLDKYSKTFDVISVPEIDIEAYAARLFGSSVPKITHQTVGSGELTFYYDEENKSYNVPVNPISFTYIPEIESISKSGSEYTLIVNYMSEIPAWMENSKNYERDASKIVEYKLIEENGSYTIASVRVIVINSII